MPHYARIIPAHYCVWFDRIWNDVHPMDSLGSSGQGARVVERTCTQAAALIRHGCRIHRDFRQTDQLFSFHYTQMQGNRINRI